MIRRFSILILGVVLSFNLNAQVSTNNPCNIGSQPGSEWPVDGVCYDFDVPITYTPLFNPGFCNAGLQDDGWAWFVGTGGNMTISYTAPATGDGILHLFAAVSNCGVTTLACSDVTFNGGTETVALTPSTLGQIYFVRVQDWNASVGMNNGCLMVSSTTAPSTPDYTQPTAGMQNEFVGSCLEATCSGLYTDDGGMSGNYSLNIPSIYRVFCPDQAGQCITATFEYFDVENTFLCLADYLTVGNGPTQNSALFTTPPALASGRICGSQAPFSYTSTHASGCLTMRFTSDAIISAPGWVATISCTPCAGGPNGTDNSDCDNFTSICANSGNAGNSSGPGIVAEGCSASTCPAGGENHTNWYGFQINAAGTLEFDIIPTVGTDDYDFALYGPGAGCGSLGLPIRCSDAGTTGNTGLATGNFDTSEDVLGNGYVAPLNVNAGDIFLLVVDEWTPTGAGYNLNFTGSATLDCTVLPVELTNFSAEYVASDEAVELNWSTKSETNADTYMIERSMDGQNFTKIASVKASGNTTSENSYIAMDYEAPSGLIYYRLNMIDKDGKQMFSPVQTVEVLKDGLDVMVFPNPSNDIMDVEFSCNGGQAVHIAIYDQAGRLLIEKHEVCEDGYQKTQLDVSSLKVGTYVLQIEMNDAAEQRLIQVSH